MSRQKYIAPTTAEQIAAAIKKEGRYATAVRYWLDDRREDAPANRLVIEVPIKFVDSLLRGEITGDNVDVPYMIVGGMMRIETKGTKQKSDQKLGAGNKDGIAANLVNVQIGGEHGPAEHEPGYDPYRDSRKGIE